MEMFHVNTKMPIQKISGGFRYGKEGKIYRGRGARTKARKQGQAIEISKLRAEGRFHARKVNVKATSRARGYQRTV